MIPKLQRPVGLNLGTEASVFAVLDSTNSILYPLRDSQGNPIFSTSNLPNSTFLDLKKSLPQQGYLLTQAVVTHPVDFSDREKSELAEKAKSFGFEAIELMSYPKAAVIYYATLNQIHEGRFLVVDLAAKTGQLSLVEKTNAGLDVCFSGTLPPIDESMETAIRKFQGFLQQANPKEIGYVVFTGELARNQSVINHFRENLLSLELNQKTHYCVDEPELSIAFGAALHGAKRKRTFCFSHSSLQIEFTNASFTNETNYTFSGKVIAPGDQEPWQGSFIRVTTFPGGFSYEVFSDEDFSFSKTIQLVPDIDNYLDVTLLNSSGKTLVQFQEILRHRHSSPRLLTGTVNRQTLSSSLQIGVVHQHHQQLERYALAHQGTILPAEFSCNCRKRDPEDFIKIPLYWGEKLIETLEISGLEGLAAGNPIQIQVRIVENSQLTVRVVIPEKSRHEVFSVITTETVRLPDPNEIEGLFRAISRLTDSLDSSEQKPIREQLESLRGRFQRAQENNDLADGQSVREELESLRIFFEQNPSKSLIPEWPHISRLIKNCLILAGEVANRGGRNRDEFFETVYSQERYAEQALEEKNQKKFSECVLNLVQFNQYLDQLRADYSLSPLDPEEEVPEEFFQLKILAMEAKIGLLLTQVAPVLSTETRRNLEKNLDRLYYFRNELNLQEPQIQKELYRLSKEIDSLAAGHSQSGFQQTRDVAGMLEGGFEDC